MPPAPQGAREQADVIVIGGGITGLTAALRIVQQHPTARVVVLEAASSAGGKIHTVRRDGFCRSHGVGTARCVPVVGEESVEILGSKWRGKRQARDSGKRDDGKRVLHGATEYTARQPMIPALACCIRYP